MSDYEVRPATLRDAKAIAEVHAAAARAAYDGILPEDQLRRRAAAMSADEARGLVFLPTTSPSPDFWGGLRPGDDGNADSVVALKAETGQVALPTKPRSSTVATGGHPGIRRQREALRRPRPRRSCRQIQARAYALQFTRPHTASNQDGRETGGRLRLAQLHLLASE